MTVQTIENRVAEYKQDIAKLEKVVKQWEVEIRIQEISKLANTCYEAFNNLQMSVSKIDDAEQQKKYAVECYNNTYQFLVFFENEIGADFCVLLMNNSKSFANLIAHYSKYCSNMERKYPIELGSEKAFGVCHQTTPRIRTVRRK